MNNKDNNEIEKKKKKDNENNKYKLSESLIRYMFM